MKALIISLFFTCSGSILMAQVDSNKVTNMTTPVNTANATMDSANNHVNSAVNSANAKMDSANNHVNSAVNATNATMDSTSNHMNSAAHNMADTATNHMNSAVNSMSNTNMNSSQMGNSMMKQPGQLGYLNLPLYKTFVPDDVSTKLKSQFGSDLYSITTIKHTLTDNAYVVRFNKTGQMQSETVDANGTVMAQ
ncbi:MAG: hypothetical protein M3Z26_02335 [Bacteroidota bacterium]|nr:hypothetical protein [Bacteroidota bacterium]